MSKVIELGKIIVNLCLDKVAEGSSEHEVNTTKLQKLLFLAQHEYVQKYRDILFLDSIVRSDCGPAITQIRNEFSDKYDPGFNEKFTDVDPSLLDEKKVMETLNKIVSEHAKKSDLALILECQSSEWFKSVKDLVSDEQRIPLKYFLTPLDQKITEIPS